MNFKCDLQFGYMKKRLNLYEAENMLEFKWYDRSNVGKSTYPSER